MKVSDRGLVELAGHEGIVVAPYRDSVGVITWGVGHTHHAGGLDPREMSGAMPKDIDAAVKRALEVFREDIAKYERRVLNAVKVPLEQHEFDALVSFDFNTGGIVRAKLTKAINAGDPNAYRHFMGWLKPPEIRGRREAEMELFRAGKYSGKPVPVWKTNGKLKLTGILKHVSGSSLLGQMRTPIPAVNFWAALFQAILKLFKRQA